MRIRSFWLTFASVAALAAMATAAPVRVGILKGTSTSRYWHASIHPGADALASMLANPSAAYLNNPVIPAQGFSVRLFGPDSTQCSGSGCGPTAEQKNTFIKALDSLDVVIVLNFIDLGQTFSSEIDRARLVDFWSTKGVVSLHQSNDNVTWSDWWNISATRMISSPPPLMEATLRLDDVNGAGQEPDWKFLNRGLPDSARFREEWLTFSQSGEKVRAGGYSSELVLAGNYPPVVVTTNLDETTYGQPLAPNYTMGGDHPVSWYRKFNTGGRFFYTALGHNTSTFDSVYFFRRQVYNAVLWAANVDSNGVVSIHGHATEKTLNAPHAARIASRSGVITVSVPHDGLHSVGISGVDGRRMVVRRGLSRGDHVFTSLRAGVHVVTVTTPQGRYVQRIMVP